MLYNVSGLQSREGKTQIRNALNKIKGVNQVRINLATSSVQVKYNEPATEMELKDYIENTGFRVEYE